MPTNKGVTEERRSLILWALWIDGPGTSRTVTDTLQREIDRKEIRWPKADWPYARNEPYIVGTSQHLRAMCGGESGWLYDTEKQTGVVLWLPDQRLYEWNPRVLALRNHAESVMAARLSGQKNPDIAKQIGISPAMVSQIYHDPFGLREKERKARYCPGCGTPKDPEQGRCVGCVRRARQQQEDTAESLLPDPLWAHSLPLRLPVDFAVYDDGSRALIVHTERGNIERQLARGETWEHAVEDSGILR